MGTAPDEFVMTEQLDVLADIEAFVRAETEAHMARRNLWFPNDHLPADERTGEAWDAELAQLRINARGCRRKAWPS